MFKNRRQQLEIRKIDKYLEDSIFVKPQQWQSHQESVDFKTRILSFLNSQPVSIFMGLLTIYTIFATDIDRSFLPAEASYYISSIHLVAIGIFSTQIILLSISQQGYFFKFYFWIDLLSTLTMFLQIIWIEDLLSAEGNIKVAISLARVTKASRLSKVGAKAFKIMKLVRLFKLMKVVEKKQQQNQKPKDQTEQDSNSIIHKIKTNTQTLMPTEKNIGEEEIILNRLQDPNPSRKLIALRKRQRSSLKLDAADIMKTSKRKKQQHFMILNLDKCISLPPLQRKNVNQQLLQQVEQKWKQLNEKQQNNNKKNQLFSRTENTKVGTILKQAIQKNVVIMIVGLIIIIPILSADTWFDENTQTPTVFLNMFGEINTFSPEIQKQLINAFVNIQAQSQLPLLQVTYQLNSTCCNFPQDYPGKSSEDINLYRNSQLTISTDDIYTIIISKKKLIQLGSQLNLGRGLFITLLLIFASILFMKDIEKYALNPLEKMAQTVTQISQNPFEIIKKIQQQQQQDWQQDYALQTKLLQGMIIKITSLLTIGTGQNGTKIITKSLSKKQLFDINSVQNKKYLCVFLYISIAHFQLISLHLQDEMIQYINILAEIIHQIAVKNGGIPCQNDGSGFLICWKNDNVNQVQDQQEAKLNFLRNFNQISTQSTLALKSLIEISLRIEKSEQIKYLLETGDEIQDIFSSKIYAGLHIGEGILGAVGSNFKIDPKFFGQDVMFTKQLNLYTRKYSISNLISEEFYNVINSSAKQKCRKVDVVKIDRYDNPIELYTMDLHFEGMVEEIPRNPQTSIHKYINSIYKERDQKKQQLQKISFSQYFENDKKFLQARRFYESGDFYDNWIDGFEKYFEGDWISAEVYFRNCYYMTDPYYDKPSQIFIQRIKKNEGFPPQDWDRANQIPHIRY